MTELNKTFRTTHCSVRRRAARRDAAGRDLRALLGCRDARRGGGRPPSADGDGRRVRAARAATGRRSRSSRSTSAGSSTRPTAERCASRDRERAGLDEAGLLIQMSHTHAGANTNSQLDGQARRELIAPYLEQLAEQVGDAVVEARAAASEAFVTYGTGRCGLAANRDFWDAEAERFACGYNPDGAADDTVLVARVTGRDGDGGGDALQLRLPSDDARLGEPAPLARLHRRRARGAGDGVRRARRSSSRAPRGSSRRATTTSATRPSPTATAASSATPRRPRSRRCRPPGTRFAYTGIVASGANLGAWEYRPATPRAARRSRRLDAVLTGVELAAQGGPRRRRERLRRDARLAAGAREGAAARVPPPRAR